jgi:type I phosphodiesterase/nucleotide pyrophosphatase
MRFDPRTAICTNNYQVPEAEMRRNQSTIVLEFNELTPSLMERFITAGRLPNFAHFRDESRVFVTEAEERPPYLEPWIQWVTVHSGLNHSDHGVFHLDEGHKLGADRIWDVASREGLRVWVCGSMNVRYGSDTNGCVLPDPWCTKVPPQPDNLEPYFTFVQRNVLEHTNDRVPLGRAEYVAFLKFMLARGLSAHTIGAIASQLASEKLGGAKWKRVVLLDLIQFDVFRHYYRRIKPHLATFFLNSTAHYQHAYWDSMEREEAAHRDAILFGYQRMDAIIGRFMRFAGRDTTLILCTALSQQPAREDQQQDGGVFYRPREFGRLARAAGVTERYAVAPVMTEQFHLEFGSRADAESAERKLKAVLLNGRPVMMTERRDTRLFTGCRLHEAVSADARLTVGATSIGFFELFYVLPTAKTGVHHPDGMLWIRQPDRRHVLNQERVPLTAVAPTILQTIGIQAPCVMKTPPLCLTV